MIYGYSGHSVCERTGGAFFLPHEPEVRLTRQSTGAIGFSRSTAAIAR